MKTRENHLTVEPGLAESEIQDNVLFRLKFPTEANRYWAESTDTLPVDVLDDEGRVTGHVVERVSGLTRRLFGRAA